MCESQVTGCQYSAWYWVKAQITPSLVSRQHMRVFVNQKIVIQVYKVVGGQPMEYHQSYKDQQQVDETWQTIRLHTFMILAPRIRSGKSSG